MPYQAFPIYDFKSGLRLNKEPFMLPFDAFDIFKNVYIDKGSIVKRKGIGKDIVYNERIIDDGYANSSASSSIDDGYANNNVNNIGNENIIDDGHANSAANSSIDDGYANSGIDDNTGGVNDIDDGYANNSASSSIDDGYATSSASSSIDDGYANSSIDGNINNEDIDRIDCGHANDNVDEGADNGSVNGDIEDSCDGGYADTNFNQSTIRPIIGFRSLRDESNNVNNYVFDTDYCYLLDLDKKRLIPILFYSENIFIVLDCGYSDTNAEDIYDCGYSDINAKDIYDGNFSDISKNSFIFNCSKDDYVQCEEWRYKLFCTNNNNRPFWVKGDKLDFINIDFDNDGNNDVDRCLLILEFKERLLLFSTTEKGTAYPQRIRWCKPNNPFDWTNDEYLDIPTSEIIISAQKLNDKIIVWCSNSVWALLYTGDFDMPFVVKCIAREIKTFGRMSAVVVEDKIFNVSDTGIIVTDGVIFEKMDVAIPRFFDNTNRIKRKIIFGYHYKPLNQIWWAYCSLGHDEKDEILYYDYLNKVWGVYTIKTNVFGEIISKKSAPAWNDIGENWDNISWAWDDSIFQDEILLTLFGGYNGEIRVGLIDYNDGEQPIEINLSSVNLNPFLLQDGRRASLGWIDFYVDCAATDLIIEFYGDNQLSPVLTQTVSLFGTTEKKWVRIKYGGRYEVHRIKIKQSTPVGIKIHAIVPYFKPLGCSRR